jgi:Mycothiol maleylpyruvate isomerase N-terminal domain
LGGAATPDFEAQRARLRSDLDAARGEFHAMVASISEREWTEPSQNPGWTNGQVVFHIRLGFILVVPLARLLVFFDRLPALCSRICRDPQPIDSALQSNQRDGASSGGATARAGWAHQQV